MNWLALPLNLRDRIKMDNRRQMFLKEAYHKEESVRFAWHLQYSKAFAKQAAATSNKRKLEAGKMQFNTTITKRIQNLKDDLKKDRLSALTQTANDVKEDNEPVILNDMRPVSPHTRTLLYKGISAHEEGRYAYLNKRKMKSPEEKFEFPITSSIQYGWKIMDFSAPKPSTFARTCVVRDTFYRSSGIMIK